MKSFWNKDEKSKFEELNDNITVDVCIVGGGLTGMSTAYYLSKQGKTVAVLDRDLISSHTSGANTGKVTSQHGLIYKYLYDSNGKEYARKYFDANEEAIKNIKEIIDRENIDCNFEEKSAYVFTKSVNELDKINQELECCKKLGIPAELVNEIELPIDIVGAIKFENQAQFDSVKYVHGLANAIINNQGKIFENSRVIDIEEKNDEYIVSTDKGSVISKYVVIATRYPIINFPGYYFLKMYQSTSFAMVFDIGADLQTDGYYINTEIPTISFRTIKCNNKNLLQVVGGDYKTGTEIAGNPFQYLENEVLKMYPKATNISKWTTEDCISLDKIAYIGNFSNIMKNIYVATGFNKWGLTTSNIAGQIISDKIIGCKNKYEDIFKSSRLNPIKNRDELVNMIKEAGDGIILRKIKDALNPTCTHLGCTLSWNPMEDTWDCACHGSRFTEKGEVIEGPAIKDL